MTDNPHPAPARTPANAQRVLVLQESDETMVTYDLTGDGTLDAKKE